MFGIIPRIARWFFEKIESEKTSHYIFILSVVFFAAFLAEIAGLEPIIGAFVAGLALNKLIPHSSALMNRIEFIGNAIFIPFFLISVGMIVDVTVLLKGPEALIIAATLTIVAILGKWLAALATQLSFKYTVGQRNVIFGLSSAHAAATLAVIMVGYKSGIIDENVLNGTILLILVTCIISTLATESASKKVVLDGNQDPSHVPTVSEQDEQILIPIANINNMEPIIDFAALIKAKKSPYPIQIISVVPNDELAEINLSKAKENLDNMKRYASGSETEVEISATVDINIASGISRAARDIQSNCILLGWPSAVNFVEKLVGEKTESILNQTTTNLFICRLVKPFTSQTKISVFVPPLAQHELGFTFWLEKITKLAQELTLPITFVCNKRSEDALNRTLTSMNSSVPVGFDNYEDWDNMLGLSSFTNENAILTFVSARQGSVSYRDALDGLAKKLERYYNKQNLILIFPNNVANEHIHDYEDVQAAPIFRKISKEIGSMFNKEKS